MTEIQSFRFSVSLHGGHLATVTVPVPISHRNVARLTRMIAEQLEPLVGEDPATPPHEPILHETREQRPEGYSTGAP